MNQNVQVHLSASFKDFPNSQTSLITAEHLMKPCEVEKVLLPEDQETRFSYQGQGRQQYKLLLFGIEPQCEQASIVYEVVQKSGEVLPDFMTLDLEIDYSTVDGLTL